MPKLKRPWGVGTRVLSLCAALALPGGPAAASTEGITVEAAEFIVSVGDGEGGERRIASTLVPYLPDQACFGWRIRLAEAPPRSEEHTSELQSLMRISYAVFCLTQKNQIRDRPCPVRQPQTYKIYMSD